jgi:hypothetical protein
VVIICSLILTLNQWIGWRPNFNLGVKSLSLRVMHQRPAMQSTYPQRPYGSFDAGYGAAMHVYAASPTSPMTMAAHNGQAYQHPVPSPVEAVEAQHVSGNYQVNPAMPMQENLQQQSHPHAHNITMNAYIHHNQTIPSPVDNRVYQMPEAYQTQQYDMRGMQQQQPARVGPPPHRTMSTGSIQPMTYQNSTNHWNEHQRYHPPVPQAPPIPHLRLIDAYLLARSLQHTHPQQVQEKIAHFAQVN